MILALQFVAAATSDLSQGDAAVAGRDPPVSVHGKAGLRQPPADPLGQQGVLEAAAAEDDLPAADPRGPRPRPTRPGRCGSGR